LEELTLIEIQTLVIDTFVDDFTIFFLDLVADVPDDAFT
jgi:hypothetical protein